MYLENGGVQDQEVPIELKACLESLTLGPYAATAEAPQYHPMNRTITLSALPNGKLTDPRGRLPF